METNVQKNLPPGQSAPPLSVPAMNDTKLARIRALRSHPGGLSAIRSIAFIPLLLIAMPTSLLAKSDADPQDFLKRLYAAHQPWAKKDVMRNGSIADYFDKTIVRLVQADRNCKAPDWGVGNLDFDPILDAQDYGDKGIGDLKIRQIGSGGTIGYEVSFLLFPGLSNERSRLEYRLAKSSGDWRIKDIQYKETTLLKILSNPCK